MSLDEKFGYWLKEKFQQYKIVLSTGFFVGIFNFSIQDKTKRMKKRLQQMFSDKRNSNMLFIFNLLVLSPLFVFSGKNFSIDSYGIANAGAEAHVLTFISAYRWFGGLVYYIFTLGGHSPIEDATIDIVIAIIVFAFSITTLTKLIIQKINDIDFLKLIVVDLAGLITIINPWFCELLEFPECIFITSIGLMLCSASLFFYFRFDNLLAKFVASVLLICSTGVYQQFIVVFTIYAILIIQIELAKNVQIKTNLIIKNYAITAFFIFVNGIIYFAIGKICIKILDLVPNERVALHIDSIIDNLKYFITHQHSFLKGRGYYDTEFLTLCFILSAIVWGIALLWDFWDNKKPVRTLFLIFSYATAYSCSYLLGIISTSHAARAMFGLFSMFSAFSIGTLVLSKNKVFKFTFIILLALLIPVNICKIYQCELSQKATNISDAIYAKLIIGEIEEYESMKTVIVDTIVFCYDSQMDYASHLDLSESALQVSYAFREMINYYSEKNFCCIKMPEEIQKKYYDSKNWVKFSPEEQIIFEDNIMYLCIY